MTEYTFSDAEYQKEVEDIHKNCIQYPYYVTIETLALCNAACNFCPYTKLERKGDKMSADLFLKIIHDLTEIPQSHHFFMHLSRVNEPFLDARIFDFCKIVNQYLPQAKLCFFSNASVLNTEKIHRLATLQNMWHMNISLNDHREIEYYQLMKLPYARTIQNLDALHQSKEKGEINFPISLSRVGDASPIDREFIDWCTHRYPLFDNLVIPRGDWMGLTPASQFKSPDVGCKQWFQLHLLANGQDAFCCIDAEGQHGFKLNVASTHALDIYNYPERLSTRQHLRSRREIPLCSGCSMYS